MNRDTRVDFFIGDRYTHTEEFSCEGSALLYLTEDWLIDASRSAVMYVRNGNSEFTLEIHHDSVTTLNDEDSEG